MLLIAAEAAARLGIRESQFRRAVRRGELPKPFLTCRPNRWLAKDLEVLSERLNVERDDLMGRIHGNKVAVR
jgi:predicted DNA-binding transcriptional regulator AlpA